MSFNSLGLSQSIVRVLCNKGYEIPTPIQEQAIPAVLEGRDVLGAAKTGTGKTAAFALPMIDLLSKGNAASANCARALVLTPTRELAAQVQECIQTYGKYLPPRSNVVYGGVKINPQMMKLRRGVDILVATPGRLLDLYRQNAIKFNEIELLVLDEADRMLDMGFLPDVQKILALLPRVRQNLLFSATYSEDIRSLAKGIMRNPVEVTVDAENSTAPEVEQLVIPVDKMHKRKLLSHLIQKNKWQQVLVFTKTKRGANKVARQLHSKGIEAAAIHGEKSQGARTKALKGFKEGDFRVLVATDIVARGLDVKELPQVVNFDLPHVAEDYVHRIGRTGRAGSSGHAYSLVSVEDFKNLCQIERLIQLQIPRKEIDGFEPVEVVPPSPKLQPQKKKRPKKKKSVPVPISREAPHKDAVIKARGAHGKEHASPKRKPHDRNDRSVKKTVISEHAKGDTRGQTAPQTSRSSGGGMGVPKRRKGSFFSR